MDNSNHIIKSPDQEAQKLINSILAIPSEDRMTEFKRLGKESKVSKIIEAIVAMANTDGGLLVLGVDDPQKSGDKGFDRIMVISPAPALGIIQGSGKESHNKQDI